METIQMDTWKVLHDYFSSDPYFITKHHIESYNDFIMKKIPLIIRTLNPWIILKKTNSDQSVNISVYIGGESGDRIYIEKPYQLVEGVKPTVLYPNEARLYDMSYVSEVYADIVVKYTHCGRDLEPVVFERVKIGTVPIMLHSCLCALQNLPTQMISELGECIYDKGSYFLIDGKEKCIVSQERNATNVLFISRGDDESLSYKGFIQCTAESGSVFPKTMNLYVYSAQYQSGLRRNAIVVTVPHIQTSHHIPLFVLFRAMGIESDRDILQYIVYDTDSEQQSSMLDFLEASVVDGNIVMTQLQALEYLKKFTDFKTIEHVKYILVKNVFPNIENNMISKAFFLGHIVRRLVMTCLGHRGVTDRDNYMYKRVDLSGMLLTNIFKDFYNVFRNRSRSKIDKEFETGRWKTDSRNITEMIHFGNLKYIFKHEHITEGMLRSMKGRWGISPSSSDLGIVQDLARISYCGFLSHLRRVNTPLDRSLKLVEPHRLNTSQWGYMCPVESPDGASIGLLKHLAMLCHVTSNINSQMVVDALLDDSLPTLGIHIKLIRECSFKDLANTTKILLNNSLFAIASAPELLVQHLRLLRRNNMLHPHVSIAWNILESEIIILTEAGRCTRPLLIVDENNELLLSRNKKKIMKWADYGIQMDVDRYVPMKQWPDKPTHEEHSTVAYGV
jgi:DNA-directed RNA polymerase II subunit RPB2